MGRAVADGVGMIQKPFRDRGRPEPQDRADTKPSEENVPVRRLGAVSESATNEFDLPEPAEKQEQIIKPDSHQLEMTLRDAFLTKHGPPFCQSGACRALHIGRQ